MAITMFRTSSTCSNFQQSIEFGLSSAYLNHDDFRRKKHGAKVTVLMGERLPGIDAPMPRPTRAHTLDFNLNFCGMHLIDGECKDTAGDAQKAVLVLHSLDQLVYKDCAHSMITTNNSFTLVQASKNMSTNRIETHLMEMPKYHLGGVKSLNPDDDPESRSPGLAFPPPYTLLEHGFTEKDMYEDDQETMKIWRGMRSQQKLYLKCIITTIDYICVLVADMPLDLIQHRRKTAYTSGWLEPCFIQTSKGNLKTHRPIPNQDCFIYCRENMDTPEEAATDVNLAEAMYEDYRKILDQDIEMSPEV